MSFIKDLITLDVVTVTGEINISILKETRDGDDETQPKSVISFDQLFNAISGLAETDGELQVIAATQINVDKDTYNFVAKDLGEQEERLLKLHFDAVNMAAESRAGLVARLNPTFRRKKGS